MNDGHNDLISATHISASVYLTMAFRSDNKSPTHDTVGVFKIFLQTFGIIITKS
jgi:hypothetical protein